MREPEKETEEKSYKNVGEDGEDCTHRWREGKSIHRMRRFEEDRDSE